MVKLILRDYRLQWKENLGCYYACMIPMLFGWILAEAFPNEMSKAMLLCPLSEEEKRRYISTGGTYRKPVMEKAIHYEYRPIPRKGERKR